LLLLPLPVTVPFEVEEAIPEFTALRCPYTVPGR
jgi:hypothetical protein